MDLGYRIRNATDFTNWVNHTIGPEPLLLCSALGVVFVCILIARIIRWSYRLSRRVLRCCVRVTKWIGNRLSRSASPSAVSSPKAPPPADFPRYTPPRVKSKHNVRPIVLPFFTPRAASTQTLTPALSTQATQTRLDAPTPPIEGVAHISTPCSPLRAPPSMVLRPRNRRRRSLS